MTADFDGDSGIVGESQGVLDNRGGGDEEDDDVDDFGHCDDDDDAEEDNVGGEGGGGGGLHREMDWNGCGDGHRAAQAWCIQIRAEACTACSYTTRSKVTSPHRMHIPGIFFRLSSRKVSVWNS